MRWISRLTEVGGKRNLVVCSSRFVSILVVLLFLALRVPAVAPEKHLSIYSTAANYSLPVVQREGRDYVGLLEVLDPLGKAAAAPEYKGATPISPGASFSRMDVASSHWLHSPPSCPVFSAVR